MTYNPFKPRNGLANALAAAPSPFGTSNAPHGLANALSREEWEIVWERNYGQQTVVLDCDNRFIRRGDYGSLGPYGWEIDHTVPTALGGLDVYANKRPRHWRGNRQAGPAINALANALSRR